MLLEELTQDDVDHLIACTKQRAVLAAIITGVMQLELTSRESVAVKTAMMGSVASLIDNGAMVGDQIDKSMITSMRDYCQDRIAMEDLLNSI